MVWDLSGLHIKLHKVGNQIFKVQFASLCQMDSETKLR